MEGTTLASRRARPVGASTRGRRRRLFFGIVAVVAVAAAFPALAGALGTDSPSPSTNIWDYTVFGWQSVNIKGQGATIGGSIGVNAQGGTATICANGSLKMADHTQLVADKLQISTLCKLYDVFYGTKPNSLASITHHGDAHFDAPLGINAPAFPDLDNCDPSKNYTLNTPGQTPTPKPTTPGMYGNLTMKDYATLRLQSGKYIFCNVNMGKNALFDLQPDTTVIVTGTMSIGNNSYVGHTPGGPVKGKSPTDNAIIYVRGDNVSSPFHCHTFAPSDPIQVDCSSSVFVNLAKHATVHATFYAPYGNINLGHDNDLFGHFWGLTITSDVAVRIGPPLPAPTTTTTSTSTSTSTTFEATTTTQPG